MTNSLPLKATLGAQVLPGLAQADGGQRVRPGSGVQLAPSGDVDSWMLIVWLAAAKFWVAKP